MPKNTNTSKLDPKEFDKKIQLGNYDDIISYSAF